MDIVKFELNDWFSGVDYPDDEPFNSWIHEEYLSDDNWCKEQEICVIYFVLDMSVNFLITAKKEWVERNCPRLLTEHTEFISQSNHSKFSNKIKFLDYKKKNFGSKEVGGF